MALAMQLLEHTAGMAAIAQGGVEADLTGLDLQELEDLTHHDRDVHTGRSLALLDDLLDLVLILFGVVLFIFFLKAAGMGALITHTALVDRSLAGFGCLVFDIAHG